MSQWKILELLQTEVLHPGAVQAFCLLWLMYVHEKPVPVCISFRKDCIHLEWPRAITCTCYPTKYVLDQVHVPYHPSVQPIVAMTMLTHRLQ